MNMLNIKSIKNIDRETFNAMSKPERIMAASEEIFSRQGYNMSTLDEIIKLADTGKGTVYKYFGNKDDLFYTLLYKKHKEIMEKLKAAAAGEKGIQEKMTEMIRAWIYFLMENQVLWQELCFEMTGINKGYQAVIDKKGELTLKVRWGKMPSEKEAEKVLRYHKLLNDEAIPMQKVFEEAMAKGLFKKTLKNSRVGKQMFFGTAMAVFSNLRYEEGVPDVDAFSKAVVEHFLYGVLKEKNK